MRENSTKTSLFLIEIMIMLLFFSLSAAICMQMFSRAQITANYSRDLNAAVLYVQSAADSYKASGGDMKQVADILDAQMSGDVIALYYHHDKGQVVARDEAQFEMLIKKQDKNEAVVEILNVEKNQTVFSVSVKAVGYEK